MRYPNKFSYVALAWLLFEGTFSVGLSDSRLANSEHPLVLLGSQQRDDRVGAYTEVVGWQSSPEARGAFLGKCLKEAVRHALVWEHSVHCLLLLEFGLKIVEWQGDKSDGNGGNHR